MAKKKHVEEHENLERWLVSYADFMTLLFATFVVLYALSQIDVNSYASLQDSIRKAFAAPSLMEGSESILPGGANSVVLNSGSGGEGAADTTSFVPPIMEYLSAKYEEKSFKDIQKSIEQMTKSGDMEGVEATIDDRGLHINLKNADLFFRSGEAKLKPGSYKTLDKISELIKKKFSRHLIRVEGHTDNFPIKSTMFPSNWELSSSRACSVARYFIDSKDFESSLIAAIGYADNKPLVPNTSEENRRKNRRVEILILKNQLAKSEPKGADTIKPSEEEEKAKAREEMKSETTSAVDELLGGSKDSEGVLVIRDHYQNNRAQAVKKLQEMESTVEEKKVKKLY